MFGDCSIFQTRPNLSEFWRKWCNQSKLLHHYFQHVLMYDLGWARLAWVDLGLALPCLAWAGQFAHSNHVQTWWKDDAIKPNYCITIFNVLMYDIGWPGLSWAVLGWPGLTLALLDLAWPGQFAHSNHVQTWRKDDAMQSNNFQHVLMYALGWSGLVCAGLV